MRRGFGQGVPGCGQLSLKARDLPGARGDMARQAGLQACALGERRASHASEGAALLARPFQLLQPSHPISP